MLDKVIDTIFSGIQKNFNIGERTLLWGNEINASHVGRMAHMPCKTRKGVALPDYVGVIVVDSVFGFIIKERIESESFRFIFRYDRLYLLP